MSLKRIFKKAKGLVKKALPVIGAVGGSMLLPGIGSKLGGFIGGKLGGMITKGSAALGNSAKGFMQSGQGWGLAGDIYQGEQQASNARDQMRFQERMSSTAHQREVSDLRAAGLNPILSGTGGGGSSTPSGASADVPNYGDRLASGLALKMQQSQIENLNAQTENTRVNSAKTVQETEKEATGKPYWSKHATLDLEKKMQEIDSLETGERLTAAQAAKAQILLSDIVNNRQLRDYIQSAPYAERKAFNAVLKGEGDASSLATVLKVLKELVK